MRRVFCFTYSIVIIICTSSLAWTKTGLTSIEQMSLVKPLNEIQYSHRLKALNDLLNEQSTQLILDQSKMVDKLSLSASGPRTGGGGNTCSLAIQQSTRKLLSILDQMPDLLDINQKKSLLESISHAAFLVRTHLILDGESKDAINYPFEKVILLSDHFCQSILAESSIRGISTLFHEYLGLAEIDDRFGQISGLLWEKYSEKNNALSTKEIIKQDSDSEKKIELLKLYTQVSSLVATEKIKYADAVCKVSKDATVEALKIYVSDSTVKLIAASTLGDECLAARTKILKNTLMQ